MNVAEPTPIREMYVNDAARVVLQWMHDTRATLLARATRPAREPLAFDAFSALAMHVGDLRTFAEQVSVLTRTHTVAAAVHPEFHDEIFLPSATTESGVNFPPEATAHVYIDATDFDAGQRNFFDSWSDAPASVSGPLRAANNVRTQALRDADVVTILPQDFIETGKVYTVATLSPGWVAMGAITRYAEIAHMRDLGVLDGAHVFAAAQFCLDRTLSAMHRDRVGVTTTIQQVAARGDDSGRGMRWSGPDGFGTALDIFLRAMERDVIAIDAVDRARAEKHITPWGHEYSRHLLTGIADAAGISLLGPLASPEIDDAHFRER